MNKQRQLIAGISGGRTSALMAIKYVPEDTVLCFQNTGREHPKTLEFLARVEDYIRRPIVRLEFRAPPRGDPPGKSTFEVVEHSRLAVKGEPFQDLLSCIAAYRLKHKGLGPIAPWHRSRICTSYMKIRTEAAYIKSLGWDDPTRFIGLRADEERRLAKMNERNEKRGTDERAPLAESGVVKADVLRFFALMPFDLEVPEHLGNCTACFEKDEADIATALLDPATDAAWWLAMNEEFGPMTPRGRPTYAQILAEAPARMEIRAQLAAGVLEPKADLPERRLKLITAQERKRLDGIREGFSCHCEGAEKMTDEDVLSVGAA